MIPEKKNPVKPLINGALLPLRYCWNRWPRWTFWLTVACMLSFAPVWPYFPQCRSIHSDWPYMKGWLDKSYRTVFHEYLTAYGGTTFWSIGGITFVRLLPFFDGNKYFDQGDALLNASHKSAVYLGAGGYDGRELGGEVYQPPSFIKEMRKLMTKYGWADDCEAMRAIILGFPPRGLSNGKWKPDEEYHRKSGSKVPTKLPWGTPYGLYPR